jgi:hypothetical protein
MTANMEETRGKLAVVERDKVHVHFHTAFPPAPPGGEEASLIFERQRRPAACHTALLLFVFLTKEDILTFTAVIRFLIHNVT